LFSNTSSDHVFIVVQRRQFVAAEDGRDGIVVASTLTDNIGSNLSGTWEFEAPKLGISFDGRVVNSNRLNKDIATQSVPLYDMANKTKIIGTLIGSINWDNLRLDLQAHTVFGDRQGEDRQVFMQSLDRKPILYATDGVDVPYSLFEANTDSPSVRRVQHSGRDFIMVSINSRPFEGFVDPRWRLHVMLDASSAMGSIDELKSFFLLPETTITSYPVRVTATKSDN